MGLSMVWAYLGIWIKHTSAGGFAGAHPAVIATTLAWTAVFTAAGVIVLLRRQALPVRG